MHFTVDQLVDAAPADVIAALTDPAFLARLGALPKVAPPEVLEQRRDGERVIQRVRYRFTGSLSPAVTRVIDPAKVVWVDETTYDLAAGRATFHIVPEHYAGKLRCAGTVDFIGHEGATTRRVAGDLSVGVPIVGRLVERAIVAGLEEHLADEGALLRAWFEVKP